MEDGGSAMEDVQYFGGYHQHCGGNSVLQRNTVEDYSIID